MKIKINLEDPQIRKLLRQMRQNNASDPFMVDRFITHCNCGIEDIREHLQKRQK